MSEPDVLTASEFAARFRVSVWTVQAWARAGKIRRVPGSRRLRIPRSEVDRLLEGEYADRDAKPDRSTSAQASPPRRGHGHQADGPLASEAVGGGGALHRQRGPSAGDVVRVVRVDAVE